MKTIVSIACMVVVLCGSLLQARILATQGSVEVELKSFQMQYVTNEYLIKLNTDKLANLLANFLSVNSTIAGLEQSEKSAHELVLADIARVENDNLNLRRAQTDVSNDLKELGKAQARLARATAELQYAQMAYQLAVNQLNDYKNNMLHVIDRSTSSAIQIIGEVDCTFGNERSICNSDPQDVFAFWANRGCHITSGFVCSGNPGTCICPPIPPTNVKQIPNFQPPNTDRDYAIISAGRLKSIVEEILAQIQVYVQDVQDAQNKLDIATNEYNDASNFYSNAVSKLQSDQALVASLKRQLDQDQAQLEADQLAWGIAQEKYNAALTIRDRLWQLYETQLSALSKVNNQLRYANDRLINSAENQAGTILCQSSSQCQDSEDGSLTFFAKLIPCQNNVFTCDTSVDSCICKR